MICKLYILADRLIIPTLQNCIATALVTYPNRYTPDLGDCIEQIWKNTSSQSKLRSLLATLYWKEETWFLTELRRQAVPAELLFDILDQQTILGNANTLDQTLNKEELATINPCILREHDQAEEDMNASTAVGLRQNAVVQFEGVFRYRRDRLFAPLKLQPTDPVFSTK